MLQDASQPTRSQTHTCPCFSFLGVVLVSQNFVVEKIILYLHAVYQASQTAGTTLFMDAAGFLISKFTPPPDLAELLTHTYLLLCFRDHGLFPTLLCVRLLDDRCLRLPQDVLQSTMKEIILAYMMMMSFTVCWEPSLSKKNVPGRS